MKLFLPVLLGAVAGLLVLSAAGARAQDRQELKSPGLPPSYLDAQGRLMEDWGTLTFRLLGDTLPTSGATSVRSLLLDGALPGVEAKTVRGPVTLTLTAYRAPVWPSGVDVLTVRATGTAGKEANVRLALDLPEGARVGKSSVTLGGRSILTLAPGATASQPTREWGYDDDAEAMTNWATPEEDCDPAFRNIRAGLGGVPIHYRFTVEPRSAFNVVLGFCESHWTQPGQRPMVCKVEGAPTQEIDPLARWGRHKPGVLQFAGKDEDGDGRLDVWVLPRLGAPDQNPILNALWLFPPGAGLNLDQVLKGKLNKLAVRFVDVGGPSDQSLCAPGKLEYALTLAPGEEKELVFLAACRDGTAPLWNRSAWTPAKLRRATLRVRQEWKEN